MRSSVALLAAPLALALVSTGAPGQDHRPLSDAPDFRAAIDRLLPEALERLEVVPGLALAVVVEDEIVFSGGYGLANVAEDVAATGGAVYYIASATKPFTALAATMLDARGDIDLESSLADHLHGVTLDPVLEPDSVMLRDLLTHTSGINNSPIALRLAFTGQHTPEALWMLLGHSIPMENAPLGTFRYTNVGYNILGMILDREIGKPWQDLLQDEIFTPLTMTRTTAYASRPREEGWPLAVPYFGLRPGGLQRVSLEKRDNTMQSAGGMMSTADDLGRWVVFQINEGRLDGRQVVDAAVVRRTHEPLVEADGGRPPFGQRAYGLGWVHGTYRDQRVLHHSGGFPGFRSLVSFMPDARVGVAVVINEGSVGSRLVDPLATWAYDWWLTDSEADADGTEVIARLVEMRTQIGERIAASLAKRAERQWTLSRPLSTYAGRFSHELNGTIEIRNARDALEVTFGNLHCVGEPYTKPETMRVELIPGSGEVIAFEPTEGEVSRIILDGETYERGGVR